MSMVKLKGDPDGERSQKRRWRAMKESKALWVPKDKNKRPNEGVGRREKGTCFVSKSR